MAAEGMQSHDQSCGNCPTASHPATKKGRINAPILPKPARCAKSDRLLEGGTTAMLYRSTIAAAAVLGALCVARGDARAWDDSKYPDFSGPWRAIRGPLP